MSNCPSCSKGLTPGANFCHGCGQMLRPFCRGCKINLPSDASYCFHCGDPLGSFSTSLRQSLPTTTPIVTSNKPTTESVQNSPLLAQDLMPTHIREKFERAKAAIEGERKLVSVLFADISGFTAMSEKLDPEQVSDIMNGCFKKMGSHVYEFEGYIDKFMGDCVMALFGAPIAHENDPELAVRCAIKMLESLAEFNQEHGLDLGLSIGINSGMVIAGGMGTDEKFDFTVMGDAVNVAQRLESAADRNQIMVSKNIAKACENKIDFEVLEPIKVKGKEQKLEVYAVKGWKKRDLQERSLQAGYSPLIGRDEELHLAEKVLNDVLAGAGQILLLSGEAGVGKSRLRHEIRKLAKRKKIHWLEVKCQSLSSNTPLFVFRRLVSKIFEIDSDWNMDKQREAFLKFSKFKLEPITKNFLAELLNMTLEESNVHELNPEQKKRGILMAIKKLLSLLSKQSPHFVYFDDLQWVDSVSKDFLSELLDMVSTKSLILGGGLRPDFKHDWHQKKNYVQISLNPLSKEKAIDMAKAILELEEVSEEFRNLLIQRAEGNPLYVEEIIKSLIDSHKIVKSDQGWQISEDLQGVEIPATLQGLIASRIDRLHAKDKNILQMGAVIGRQFSDLLLGQALGEEVGLYESLHFLRKRELIFEVSSNENEIDYVFNHVLTQEVAYQSILKKKRKDFHLQVAQAIEHLVGQGNYGSLEDHFEELATHYRAAEESQKAIYYLQKSATQMRESFDNQGAIRNLKLVEDELRNLKPSSKELAETLFELSEVYTAMADYESSEKNINEVIAISEKRDDQALLARAYRRIGDNARVRGQLVEGQRYLSKSLEIVESLDEEEFKIRTYKSMANLLKMTKKLNEALDYFQRGIEKAKKLGLHKLEAEFLNDLGTLYIAQNNLDEAEKVLSNSKKIAEEGSFKALLVSATINVGAIQYYRNNFKEALNKFREAAKLSEEIGDLQNAMLCQHNMGAVSFQFENFEEAKESFEASLKVARDLNSHWDRVNNLLYLAYCKTRLSEGEEGRDLLQATIEECEERQYENYLALGIYLMGRYYADQKDHVKAAKNFEMALQKCEELKDAMLAEKIREETAKLKATNVHSMKPSKSS